MKYLTDNLSIFLTLLTVALALSVVFLWYDNRGLKAENRELSTRLAQEEVRMLDLQDLLAKKDEQVEVHKELLRIFREQSAGTAYDLSAMRRMVEEATKTVADIKKLEEADEELLAKYSKVYFLNEHYTPERLSIIPVQFTSDEKVLEVRSEVLPFLERMLSAMRADGLVPEVLSAYRSFDYQGDVKHGHEVTYGTSETSRFVADQGYSEHQLGTTVDVTNKQHGANLLAFDETSEYQWLLEHAHEYGFVLSYPEENGYYAFEPWHWRFVGVALASHLRTAGKHFYDLPQREINAYRLKMFEE
ncbi:MAG: M15 family metallopeptidase [bacterium]|nr:M15 family metallopeptidase [bacterium]